MNENTNTRSVFMINNIHHESAPSALLNCSVHKFSSVTSMQILNVQRYTILAKGKSYSRAQRITGYSPEHNGFWINNNITEVLTNTFWWLLKGCQVLFLRHKTCCFSFIGITVHLSEEEMLEVTSNCLMILRNVVLLQRKNPQMYIEKTKCLV